MLAAQHASRFATVASHRLCFVSQLVRNLQSLPLTTISTVSSAWDLTAQAAQVHTCML